MFERVKKGQTFPSIAETMCLAQSYVQHLYYESIHPNVVDYRAKKAEGKAEKAVKQEEKKKEREHKVEMKKFSFSHQWMMLI